MKFAPGKLTVISGPAACGKSCLLQQVANANAAAGLRVLLIDLQFPLSRGRFARDRQPKNRDVETIRNPRLLPSELMALVTDRRPDVLCVDGADGDCGALLSLLAASKDVAVIATVTTFEGVGSCVAQMECFWELMLREDGPDLLAEWRGDERESVAQRMRVDPGRGIVSAVG